jgi:catechol 2,3-dioxygenase-like lactoylglutathione lyase family enzyme
MFNPHVIPYVFLYVSDLERSRAFYERVVGLRVLEEDPDAVKYDTGDVVLALNRASDYGVVLRPDRDDSVLVVFHTPDLDATRADLISRGAEFDPTLRYEIGATACFYDPDGHCLCLYEPSEDALTWPSARKILSVLGGAPARGASMGGDGLSASKIVYVFLFVSDADRTTAFYRDRLGLEVVEEDPESGVVKYDAGGFVLATHRVGGDAACAVEMDLSPPKSVSFTVLAPDIESAYAELGRRGLAFDGGIHRSPIGAIARFNDPDGHMFYLYTPSEESLTWPSGPRLRELTARYVSVRG